jgi:uncharacterized membrane protein
MISTASVAKHPIHPMLVPLPIGLWIFSVVCDIVFRMQGDMIWNRMAFYTMAVGVIGALLAALPGFVDLFTMSNSPVKKIGIWHMSVNLTIVVLFALDFLWRRNADPAAMGPLVLSIVAILLLVVSGWLGGEMVYVHGVAVAAVDGKKPIGKP